MPYNNWAAGQTGSVTGFSQNGDGNSRVLDTDPWGNTNVVVWDVSNQDATSNADGGWNSSTISGIDKTYKYRFTTWVRRKTIGNGSFYLGYYSRENGTNTATRYRVSSSTTTNPYFKATSWWGSANTWYLVVGHVWPAGTGIGSNDTDTGIWTTDGHKIINNNDFVWSANANGATHRTYLYYSTNTSTNQQFAHPRVDKIDGNEPSIANLLGLGNLPPAGATGATGAGGRQGAQGVAGFQGRQGTNPTGVTGSTGTTGVGGVTGPAGSVTGRTGRTGVQGYQGTQGATGAQGRQGPQGGTGPAGSVTGRTGVQGYTGRQGAQGLRGPQGSRGPQGGAGTAGVRGPQGPTGRTGRTGVAGRQGVQGYTGRAGRSGAQGFSGRQGNRGPQGPTGPSSAEAVSTNLTGSRLRIGTNSSQWSSPTGSIWVGGGITAGYSDERLKEQIEVIKDAVQKLKSITGIYFKVNELGKSLGLQDNGRKLGLIAQQIEEVAPELIAPAPINKKYKTVKYDRVVALLLQAIKEQQAQINILRQKLEQRELNG
ncbi:tail fiber domain-containing protein [bacterium]|nr:tail fiber domain-containing protein [bacterium]